MNHSYLASAVVSAALFSFVGALQAQPLPLGNAAQAGFSAEGLGNIDAFFEREVQASRVPGAVIAIARDGKLIYQKAYGFLDNAQGTPMPVDAIFALASMTKKIGRASCRERVSVLV